MEDFLKRFADQFDDTDISEMAMDTEFHELDEWSSLIGLAVMNMIQKKYGVKLTPQQMKDAKTIQDLYDVVANG